MWCPPGQVTFLEIEKSIRSIVKSVRTRLYDCREMTIVDVGAYEQALLRNCITEFFSNVKSLSVHSVSGESLRINPIIASHRLLPRIGWEYLFVDKAIGIVSEKQFQKCFSAMKPRLTELRARADELETEKLPFDVETEHCEYSEYCYLSEIEDAHSYWSVFRNFDGWAVGCDEKDIPRDPIEFVSLDEQVPGPQAAIPDRDMVSEILEAFDAGYIRSKDDLWRTAFRGEKREAFRAAWSTAATLRPDLSKRGPKSL